WHALIGERRGEFLAQERILLVIRDRAAALAQVDGAVVHELLAGAAGLARALVVGAMPGGDAQPLLAYAEVLVEPVARHRRCRDEADWLVILAQHLVGLAILPGRGAERFRPRVGVALALDADEDRCRLVLVRLRIAPGLVLADPHVETVVRHLRLDAAIAGRAPVIERQLGIDDVGDEIGPPHGRAAGRIGSGSTSSRGLKKSSAPEKRSIKLCGQLKMKLGLSSRFMTFGADVPHRSSAGELAALMKRWNALSGIANSEPFCHSNVCFL